MYAWRAACKFKFRIPSQINTKQIVDIMSPHVCRCFLFFILTLEEQMMFVLIWLFLLCGKGNAHNKSEVFGTFK